ncbi:MAG: hypothetical protein ABR976_09095 [Terracidiphilus sp.]
MTTLYDKLQLKGQQEMLVLNAPASFEGELAKLPVTHILRDIKSAPEIHFSLAFVTKQTEVDALAAQITKRAKGDAAVWFAYPKGTSKKYKCDFNRDTGWAVLHAAGFDTVRSIAIDEDWTALRFRRTEYIKSAKR